MVLAAVLPLSAIMAGCDDTMTAGRPDGRGKVVSARVRRPGGSAYSSFSTLPTSVSSMAVDGFHDRRDKSLEFAFDDNMFDSASQRLRPLSNSAQTAQVFLQLDRPFATALKGCSETVRRRTQSSFPFISAEALLSVVSAADKA